jgi:hypothetical protein
MKSDMSEADFKSACDALARWLAGQGIFGHDAVLLLWITCLGLVQACPDEDLRLSMVREMANDMASFVGEQADQVEKDLQKLRDLKGRPQ